MSKPDEVDVVIAFYNEDLKWLLETTINKDYKLVDYCIIYCKGPNEPSDEIKQRCKKWIKLSNVGRESHTYIHHFIENYDSLKLNTVCLQGSIADHMNLIVSGSIENYINSKEQLYGINGMMDGLSLSQPIQHYGIWLEKLNDGRMQKSSFRSTMEWIANIFNIRCERMQKYPVIYGGNFSVNKEAILRIKKEEWEKALEYLNYPDPENGHYQERSWAILFLKNIFHK